LGHPNLVSIHDVGESTEGSFVVMELPEGPTLEQLRGEAAAIPLERRIFIMMQLAGALHYAHHRGLVHGEIRPANVILPDDAAVKLGDFGMDKPLDTATAEELAQAVTAYTAPEQLHASVDARSDQYSLAAVFHELLSGQPPYSASDKGSLLEALRSEAPPRLADVRPALAPDLVRIVERAMSREPAERYADLRQMRTDLEAVHNRIAADETALRTGASPAAGEPSA